MCGSSPSAMNECIIPAFADTAKDTERDNVTFAPPANIRGDVARALFYNLLRYEEQLGLSLSDCGPFGPTTYGYLSQLLTWHEEDPVDQIEMTRNSEACYRWQGNRNVFIDFPELVPLFYGLPEVLNSTTKQYKSCAAIVKTSNPVPAPMQSPTPSPMSMIDTAAPTLTRRFATYYPTGNPAATNNATMHDRSGDSFVLSVTAAPTKTPVEASASAEKDAINVSATTHPKQVASSADSIFSKSCRIVVSVVLFVML